MYLRLLLAAALLSAAPCGAGLVYSYDDGSGEGLIVDATNSGYWFWLNGFQALPGGASITTIQLAFHPSAPVGTAVTAYLWSDPTNDGDPSDAVSVRASLGTITGTGNVFFDFPITPYSFSPGDWFFVGASAFLNAGEVGPYLDLSSSAGQSWVALLPGQTPDNLAGSVTNLNLLGGGNWMVRAVGVPEPQTGLLVAGALGAFVLWRRRKQAGPQR